MDAAAGEDVIHTQRYLPANCFGDHYTRTGLDLPTRELITLAVLAALGGCEPAERAEGRRRGGAGLTAPRVEAGAGWCAGTRTGASLGAQVPEATERSST